MNYQHNYDRLLLALDDARLEEFVRQWVNAKKEYFEVERFSGPGDLGRDVVGFLKKERHEGPWHNYQCKQYGRSLPTEQGILEVGKILYNSYAGHFTVPTKFLFVAPRGVNRNLKHLIFNPSEFKRTLIENWDEYCAKKISDGVHIPMDPTLKQWIEKWDFSAIRPVSTDMIISDPSALPVLSTWFGADPGPAPKGTVPDDVEAREMVYIQELLDAYGERENCTYPGHVEVMNHPQHGRHLYVQRERFFDTDAFMRFYRDSTKQEEIDGLKRDVYHGIFDVHHAIHADTLGRIDAVMTQAANTQPSGALAKYARVPVKQGICHHFVNEGQLRWRKN